MKFFCNAGALSFTYIRYDAFQESLPKQGEAAVSALLAHVAEISKAPVDFPIWRRT